MLVATNAATGVSEFDRKDQIMNLVTVGALCGIVALVLVLVIVL